MERRVLVVDDEPAIVAGLTSCLAFENVEAAGASDRPTAAALVGETHYAVIVADLCLVTYDEGLALIDEVRRLSPNSRILTLTGYAPPDLEAAVLQRGAERVLSKADDTAVILDAILEVLEELERAADAAGEVDLEALYLHTQKVLRSIPQRRFGLPAQQAEDVVQDAWLLFLEKRGYVRTPRAWLAGTVSKLCLQQLDRLRRQATDSDDDAAAGVAGPNRGAATALPLMVRQALGRLDERSRELCIRIAIEGHSYAEVCAAMSLPAGSVGPLYIRAKNRLREALEH
jgi:RNA polymerase sigma factor (sigma-70 family)